MWNTNCFLKKKSNDWKTLLLRGLFLVGLISFLYFDMSSYLTNQQWVIAGLVFFIFLFVLNRLFFRKEEFEVSYKLSVNISWYQSINWIVIIALIASVLSQKDNLFSSKLYLFPILIIVGYLIYRFYKGDRKEVISIGILGDKLYFDEPQETYYISIQACEKIHLSEKQIVLHAKNGCSDKLKNYQYSTTELNEVASFLKEHLPQVIIQNRK